MITRAAYGHMSTGRKLDIAPYMTHDRKREHAHPPMLNKTPIEGEVSTQAPLDLPDRFIVVGGEKERVPVSHEPCVPLRRCHALPYVAM